MSRAIETELEVSLSAGGGLKDPGSSLWEQGRGWKKQERYLGGRVLSLFSFLHTVSCCCFFKCFF